MKHIHVPATIGGTRLKHLLVALAVSACAILGANAQHDSFDLEESRVFFNAMAEALPSFHVDYTIKQFPITEDSFPGGKIENAITGGQETTHVLHNWFAGLRESYTQKSSLDVFGRFFVHHEKKYDLADSDMKYLRSEAVSSYDGHQNYAYWPEEKQGTIATDSLGRAIPHNPVSMYSRAAGILGDGEKFSMLSTSTFSEGHGLPDGKAGWRIELRDSTQPHSHEIHQFFVDPSTMYILQHRIITAEEDGQRTIQKAYSFADAIPVDFAGTSILLPKIVVHEEFPFGGDLSSETDPPCGRQTIFQIDDLRPTELKEEADFSHPFPAGTKVWIKDIDHHYIVAGSGKQMPTFSEDEFDFLEMRTATSSSNEKTSEQAHKANPGLDPNYSQGSRLGEEQRTPKGASQRSRSVLLTIVLFTVLAFVTAILCRYSRKRGRQ